ncbi:MAG: transposase [Bacteroidales bacterium]|jgi:putative transposase|nr:transposase [Bacteroidales bacterium]
MTTYTKILYQIVFGSKSRNRFFEQSNQEQLFNYLAGISRNKKCYPYKIGGDTNHVHLIVELHKTQYLSGYVQEVKKAAHNWIRNNRSIYPRFQGWQIGYSAFTYDFSTLENLRKYVESQNEHHEIVTFEEEYITLLRDHGIDYNEKYLWE